MRLKITPSAHLLCLFALALAVQLPARADNNAFSERDRTSFDGSFDTQSGRSHSGRGFFHKWLTDPTLSARARNLAKQGFDQHYKNHNPEEAAKLFAEAIKLAPKCSSLYKERADCELDEHNYKGAIADFTSAYEFEPKDIFAIKMRAFAYCEAKEYKLAIDDYTKVLAERPDDRHCYDERAKAERLLGRDEDAKKDIDKAHQLALPQEAQFLAQHGALGQGLAAINRAIAQSTDDKEKWDLLIRRANVYIEAQKYSAAEIECTKLLSEPKLDDLVKARILTIRGDARIRMDHIDKAVVDYNSALTLCTASSAQSDANFSQRLQQSIRVKLGLAYFEQCKYAQAIADYTKAIKLHDRETEKYGSQAAHTAMLETMRAYWKSQHINVDKRLPTKNNEHTSIFAMRGDAYMMSGDCKKALADYEKAHREAPTDIHCLFEGSLAAEKLGDLPLSSKLCSDLIELSPSTSDFYLRRANLETKQKQFQLAEDDYAKGIKLDPTDAVAYESRGELHLSRGEYGDAAKDFTNAINAAPDSKSMILVQRALAYDKMKRPDLAAQDRKDAAAGIKQTAKKPDS